MDKKRDMTEESQQLSTDVHNKWRHASRDNYAQALKSYSILEQAENVTTSFSATWCDPNSQRRHRKKYVQSVSKHIDLFKFYILKYTLAKLCFKKIHNGICLLNVRDTVVAFIFDISLYVCI